MKAFVIQFIITLLFVGQAKASEMTITLDLADSERSHLTQFAKEYSAQGKVVTKIIFEFVDSHDLSQLKTPTSIEDEAKSRDAVYEKTYPNGDFYYLIGDLDDQWTKQDFLSFYRVAKWLSQRGFRTIINVVAFIPDMQEAISNTRTSAIIWNSHGTSLGEIKDSKKNILPTSIFTQNRSPKLKYVFFSNCYGYNSITLYKLNRDPQTKAYGMSGEVSSNDLFAYLYSAQFVNHLSEALGKPIEPKGTKAIDL